MVLSSSSTTCTFHHVPADAVDFISSSIGISTKHWTAEAQVSCACSIAQAHEIRSKLASLLRPYPQIWLSIDMSAHSKETFLPFNTNIGNDIHVSFGSLLSTSRFLIHNVPLHGSSQWTMTLPNQNTLEIKQQDATKTSMSFSLSIEHLTKHVLVIDGDTHTTIILNTDNLIKEVQATNGTQSSRYTDYRFSTVATRTATYLDYTATMH